MTDYVLRLFVMGDSDRSERAIKNCRSFCETAQAENQYSLEIIDVLIDPQAAEDAGIFATPTLMRHNPPPPKKVIGDLAEREKVLRILDIHS